MDERICSHLTRECSASVLPGQARRPAPNEYSTLLPSLLLSLRSPFSFSARSAGA